MTKLLVRYADGQKMFSRFYLRDITCHTNGETLGKYTLKYSLNQNKNRLLTELSYAAGEQSYNPLKFGYGNNGPQDFYEENNSIVEPYFIADRPSLVKTLFCKFDYTENGTGLIALPNRTPYWQNNSSRGESHYRNLYTPNDAIIFYPELQGHWVIQASSIPIEDGFVDVLSMDIEGQQKENIITINNLRDTINGREILKFQKYEVNQSFGQDLICTDTYVCHLPVIPNPNPNRYDIHPKYYYPGDFNGDGKMELLAVSINAPLGCNDTKSQCYLFDLNDNKILFQGNFSYNVNMFSNTTTDIRKALNESEKLLVLDYDGDGKTDICIIRENGISVYSFEEGSQGLTCKYKNTCSDINLATIKNSSVHVVEANGDNMMDLLISPDDQKNYETWKIYHSWGNGKFELNSRIVEHPNPDDFLNSTNIIHDVNGDGILDLITYNDSCFSTYAARDMTYDKILTTKFDRPKTKLVTADINSHNRPNQLIGLNDNILTMYSFSRNDGKEALLTQMTNSLGVTEVNRYELMDDAQSDVYTYGFGAVFPYINLNESFAVLAESATYMNDEQIDLNDYQYENAIAHKQGLGFCGFERLWQCTNKGDIVERKYDPYSYGVLVHESSSTNEADYEYSLNVSPDKFIDINLTSKQEKDLLKDQTVTYAYEYDDYGFPTKETAVYPDNITITTENKYSSNSEAGDGYHIGYLTDKSVTTDYNGSKHTERTQVVRHDNRNPMETFNFVNGNQSKHTFYTYNEAGQLELEKYFDYTGSAQFIRSIYDDYGRVEYYDGPDDLSDRYYYDSYNRIIKVNDGQDNITKYVYDSFGNIIETTFDTGTKETVTYEWIFRN